MLYAGLDLSRKRLDFHLVDADGATVEVGAAPPDADGLYRLTQQLDRYRTPICAAIESMTGARFVHDRFELAGWQVGIADAQKVKGLAPLACKTDRIDAGLDRCLSALLFARVKAILDLGLPLGRARGAAAQRLPSRRRVPLWGDSDGWPRTPQEHTQCDAYHTARRDLSKADRHDYNTVVRFGGQTAAEQRAVRRERTRSREIARVKRRAAQDP